MRIEIYGNNKFLVQINNKAELFGKMAQVVKLHLSKNSPNYVQKKQTKQTKINLSVMLINQDTICKFMIVVGSIRLNCTIKIPLWDQFY